MTRRDALALISLSPLAGVAHADVAKPLPKLPTIGTRIERIKEYARRFAPMHGIVVEPGPMWDRSASVVWRSDVFLHGYCSCCLTIDPTLGPACVNYHTTEQRRVPDLAPYGRAIMEITHFGRS